MKNNIFVKFVAVMLVVILSVGVFSFTSLAEEKVISDEEYTDLSYDNGTVIVKIDGGKLSELVKNREFTKEAFMKLLPSGLYNIYKERTKASVVDFLCTLIEKDVLTHEELLRLFNDKSDILDLYVPAEYWEEPHTVEGRKAKLQAMGGTKVTKDIRNFFVQVLLNEVDEMTCNGVTIFTGDPDWEFDHNAIQTVVLKSLPTVEEAAQLKDGDALIDLAFASTGPNVNFEFGFKLIITGDCSYINEQAAKFVDEVSYAVEDSGTVTATVTFDERFAEFYADVLNSDKLTEERKFELLGIYTLNGTDLVDAITNEEVDEMVTLGSIASEERAARIESFRGLLTRILTEIARVAPRSDTVAGFTSIADNYKGNGEFSYTIHEEFSFEAAVNSVLNRVAPTAAKRLPAEWSDLISKDDHIIDQTTTITIADFYRVRYYDADNNLLYLTFMPVGFDLTYLNAAAELQGHGADGWYDVDVPGGDAVTVMPDKDIDLKDTPTVCEHTFGDPVWTWADDYSSATAKFTCTVCGDEWKETDSEITVSEDKVNRTITYTAEVLFKGETYTDIQIVDMGPCEHTYDVQWTWADDYSSATATFTCTECGDVVGPLDATVTSEEDTENGMIIYTATVNFNNTDYIDTQSEPIPPCEHTYGDPVWNWADDYSSATATFTCTKCGDTKTVTATVTSEEDTENGKIIYTATVTFDGKDYIDTKSVDIPECEHTYGEPEWTWADDYSSATATFTCSKCGDTKTVTATVTSAEDTENGVIVYTAEVTFEGKTYTDEKTEPIPPCEHTYGEPVWEWSDDYTSATATFTCSKCGETVTVTAEVTTETDEESGTITHTATVTFEGTVYTDSVTETPPPPTGEAVAWIAAAGAALIACPACLIFITRRRKNRVR